MNVTCHPNVFNHQIGRPKQDDNVIKNKREGKDNHGYETERSSFKEFL